MTGLPSRTTSVSTATRLIVILSKEMTALRIGEGIGATASRMRVIFMLARLLGCYLAVRLSRSMNIAQPDAIGHSVRCTNSSTNRPPLRLDDAARGDVALVGR